MSPTRRLAPSAAALCALVAAGLLASCSGEAAGSDDGRVAIVASTSVYGDLAASVGGAHVDVTAMVSSSGQDPHSFEADTRDILAVSRAALVIENGGGYDDFMDQLLDSAEADPRVVNAVDVSGLAPAAGGEFNEHVWYDLGAMRRLVGVLADDLADIDPDHAADYRANADEVRDALQVLVDRERGWADRLGGASVAITEPVPGYLIEALGLQNLTPPAFSEAIEEGEDVPVAVLDETLTLFADGQVAALVYNEQTTGATTELVRESADDAGVPIVGVTETLPEGEHYAAWMAANIEAVGSAVEGR